MTFFFPQKLVVTNLITFSGDFGDFDVKALVTPLSEQRRLQFVPPPSKNTQQEMFILLVQTANHTWVSA